MKLDKRQQRLFAANGGGYDIVANPTFWAPLETTIVPARGTGSATFTRATTATGQDWEGRIFNALSGEARFKGVRRVRNLVADSDHCAGSGAAGGTGTVGTSTSGFTAPDGSATAYRIQADRGAGGTAADISRFDLTMGGSLGTAGVDVYVSSIWLKSNTGAAQNLLLHVSAGGGSVTIDGEWRRYSVTQGNFGASLGICSRGTFNTTQALDVLIWHPQLELVTGQSNQNPSEYVSTGALASPYHGANVDGVKYFKTLNGNTVTSNVVTEATGAAIPAGGIGQGWVPNDVSGSWFTTPDAADNRVTTQVLRLQWEGVLTYSLLGAGCQLIGKDGGGANRSYALQHVGGPKLRFFYTTDGSTTAGRIADSTANHAFADNTKAAFRADYDPATGNVTFYTAPGIAGPWTQLGAVVPLTSGAVFAGTATVGIARSTAGVASPAYGTYYRAQLYKDGVLTMDFDPQQWTTGGSFTSGGAVWTLNGGAKVLKYPLGGYLEEEQFTNLVLQSENFGTTWAAGGTPTRVAAALRCGSVVLDLIGDDDAAANELYSQPVTFTADGAKAVSCFFAQGTSTSSVVRIQDSTAVAERLIAAITWTNGIPTVTMTNGTLLGVDTLGNGVFRARVLTAAITAANVHNIYVYPATTAAFVAGNTGTAYFGGVMAENNDQRCTSYIPTTTATVTRNADRLSYLAAGNLVGATGTTYAEIVQETLYVAGNPRVLGNGSSGSGAMLLGTAQPRVYDGTTYATSGLGNITAGISAQVAASWGGATMKAFKDGVAGGAQAFDGVMLDAAANITIGCGTASTEGLCGCIKNLRIWRTTLSDATVQSIPAAA